MAIMDGFHMFPVRSELPVQMRNLARDFPGPWIDLLTAEMGNLGRPAPYQLGAVQPV